MKTTAQKKAELELKLARIKDKERNEETRKKILLGAFVLEQMKKNGIDSQLVTYESSRFVDFLIRDVDRALFGLPPLPKKKDVEQKGL